MLNEIVDLRLNCSQSTREVVGYFELRLNHPFAGFIYVAPQFPFLGSGQALREVMGILVNSRYRLLAALIYKMPAISIADHRHAFMKIIDIFELRSQYNFASLVDENILGAAH